MTASLLMDGTILKNFKDVNLRNPKCAIADYAAKLLGMSKADPMMIGARIKAIRDAASLSQAALASRLDVSANLVSQWETGRSKLQPHHLEKLCPMFRVTSDFVLFGDTKHLTNERTAELERFLS